MSGDPYLDAIEQLARDVVALAESVNATTRNVAEIRAMLTTPFDHHPHSLRAEILEGASAPERSRA